MAYDHLSCPNPTEFENVEYDVGQGPYRHHDTMLSLREALWRVMEEDELDDRSGVAIYQLFGKAVTFSVEDRDFVFDFDSLDQLAKDLSQNPETLLNDLTWLTGHSPPNEFALSFYEQLFNWIIDSQSVELWGTLSRLRYLKVALTLN